MTTTLILGASHKPHRFSNKAQRKLTQNNHQVVLVNPRGGSIEGVKCYSDINEVTESIHTVTVYVNPSLFAQQLKDIIKLKPKRVIFNPGTESEVVKKTLIENDISVVESCTLIMLDSGQY